MDVPLLRDWVIIILGIVDIIIMIVLFILAVVAYRRVSDILKKAKAAISSPYYKLATWVLGYLLKKDKK